MNWVVVEENIFWPQRVTTDVSTGTASLTCVYRCMKRPSLPSAAGSRKWPLPAEYD